MSHSSQKRAQGKGPAQGQNAIEELAHRLDREGRLADLERELQQIDRLSLSDPEREAWWHLFGIAAFREGRHAEAFDRFQRGYELFPSSAPIRFSLGQQYERAREAERAFELFSRNAFPEIPRGYALAQARYAYLWDRYATGREFIRPFFDIYKRVRVLDDHFLYVRGLPFFGQAWSYLAAFSALSGEWDEIEAVTRFVVEHCSDYDFEQLQAELSAYRAGDPTQLIAPLEKRLKETPAGVSTGYTRMCIAVARARLSSTADDAAAILNQVTLEARDFPWPEDVRTLATAEIARRFGRPEIERTRLIAFVKRQPLLFEPDIALNFHLLQYQENLKPSYRSQAALW